MIAIRINRQHWLNLPDDIKLDITLTSPVFSDKVVEENSVYNFQVPNNPHNAAVFGFPGKINTFEKSTVKLTAEVFFKNQKLGEGTAFVRKAAATYIELVIGFNESSFSAIAGSKYITDFEYGGMLTYKYDYSDQPDSLAAVCESIYPEVPFAIFPIKNVAIFDGSDWEADWLHKKNNHE